MTRRLLLLLCLASPVLAQAPQASIAGVILNDDNRPIARAVVTVSGPALRPSTVTMTDANGRFTVSGLPAGQFILSASKTPYLTMAYGQTTPGRGAGVPVSLGGGQQIAGLTWKLPRGAVIRGTVRDDTGQPMREIPIVLMQYRTVSDRRSLTNVTCCVWPLTESDGTYRVAGIEPGDYIVSAIPSGSYVYIPSGPFSGGAEARSIDPAEMQWALRQVADGRGGGVNAGPPTQPAADPPPGRTVAYARVYYPGTVDESAATTLSLRSGEERQGIDLLMKLEPTARITGRIVGPDGQTPASISLTRGGATTSGGSLAAGTFTLTNLPSGRHTLTARAAGPLWGSIDVDLRGEDVLDVVLRLERGVTLAGRVVFEPPATGAAPEASRARIALRPPTPLARAVAANADGSFLVSGTDPGSYRLTATLAAPAAGSAGPDTTAGWVLKSATWNGRDITDLPFDVRPGDALTDVVVTFTSRTTELSGTLMDAVGRPAPGFYVAVFPTDPLLWVAGSRRMPTPARAATDGKFRFVGLPPGNYHAVALTNVDPADFSDAAFLKQLAAAALTITLGEGEKKVQDLKFSSR